jgi:hypothetical protein
MVWLTTWVVRLSWVARFAGSRIVRLVGVAGLPWVIRFMRLRRVMRLRLVRLGMGIVRFRLRMLRRRVRRLPRLPRLPRLVLPRLMGLAWMIWIFRLGIVRLSRVIRLVGLGRSIVRLWRVVRLGFRMPRFWFVRFRLLYTIAGIIWLGLSRPAMFSPALEGLVLRVVDLPTRLGNWSRDSS